MTREASFATLPMLLLLLLVSAVPLAAQILPNEASRRTADVGSWVSVGVDVALDTKASKDADGWRGVGKEGARLGIVYTAGFAIKKLVGKERPCATLSEGCGIDNPHFSFWSLHASVACSAVRVKDKASWILAAVTMAGRVLAGKHDWIDVGAGCGAGLLAGLIR